MSKIVLTYEDKVEACKEYFNKFNKKPRFRDVMMYKNTKFKIGYFIQSIKQGYYPQNIRDGVINIFGSDAFDSKKDLKLTNEDKLNACRLFKQKFNRVPKSNDKMEFNNVVFNIGYFIHDIKAGHNSSIKPLVDEIFKDFKIGMFIDRLKKNNNKHLKLIVLNIVEIEQFDYKPF